MLTWRDVDEVAFQLHQAHPTLDPLTLRFTELHRHVVALEEFSDDPLASSEGILESIQMAWLEYFQDA